MSDLEKDILGLRRVGFPRRRTVHVTYLDSGKRIIADPLCPPDKLYLISKEQADELLQDADVIVDPS